MPSIRDAWRLWSDIRKGWALWDQRDEFTYTEILTQGLDIADNWVGKEMVALVRKFVPYVDPWMGAWQQKDCVMLWDTTVDMFADISEMTDAEIDDTFVQYARNYRDIGIVILQRVIGGADIDEAVYSEIRGVDDPEGVFGAAGSVGSEYQGGSTIVAIGILLNILRFIMELRE